MPKEKRHSSQHTSSSSSPLSNFSGFKAFQNNNTNQQNNKNKFKEYVNTTYHQPQNFLNETNKKIEKLNDRNDPFEKYRIKKTLMDNENEYTSKWRDIIQNGLSPDRIDPFISQKNNLLNTNKEKNNTEKRSYAEIYENNKLDREKKHLLLEIKRNNNSTSSNYSSNENKEDLTINCGISFELSGILGNQMNTINQKGTILKWQPTPEIVLPSKTIDPNIPKWSLYLLKNEKVIPNEKPIQLNLQKSWLFGRDSDCCDILLKDISCSKQHAILCFRKIKHNTTLNIEYKIKPFLIDLQSTNGTFLNNKKIEESRYYELKEFDIITFGNQNNTNIEYMILNDQSKFN